MLNEIKKNLNNQNNRATADPIYVVYDYEKVPSCEDYTDKYEFCDSEGFIAKNKEDLIDFVVNNDDNEFICREELLEKDEDELLKWIKENSFDDIEKFYYIKKRIFINVFFTEDSAKKFIKQNHYHYTKDIHIYVNCLWRNPEMQYIRNNIKDGTLIIKK